MSTHHVVLLQSDPGTTQSLIASLSNSFPSIYAVYSLSELRSFMSQHRPEVAILDMAIASMPDVSHLCRDFPHVSMICNHRLADEEMWMTALKAGAADCCCSADTRSIVMAALENADPVHHQAA